LDCGSYTAIQLLEHSIKVIKCTFDQTTRDKKEVTVWIMDV